MLSLFLISKKKKRIFIGYFCGKNVYSICMTFESIKNLLEEKFAHAPTIGAKLKIDFGDDGILLVDATQSPAVVTEEDGDADTTFICTLDLLRRIIDGTQDPTMAFMMGKLKVQGSMGYAMKLNSVLGD